MQHSTLRLIFALVLVCGLQLHGQNISLVGELNHAPSAGFTYGDVWAEGNIACTGIWLPASNTNGVAIFSITNPAAPVLLSNYRSPEGNADNQFEQGVVRNKIGYFASWSGGGVHIVSLTNPSTPVRLSKIGRTTGTATNGWDRVHTMFLERNFLYEASHAVTNSTITNYTYVKIFDVSNPSLPKFVQDVPVNNTWKTHQITVAPRGTNVWLYTSGWGDENDGNPPGRTDIWDVTTISSDQPAILKGSITTGVKNHSSWPTPDGNTLFICREMNVDIEVWNISNPASPLFITNISASTLGIDPEIAHNPVVVSNLLFVSWYGNGLQVFNIANLSNIVHVGSYDTYPGAFVSGAYRGDWGVYPFLGLDKVLLCDMQRGLLVVDCRNVTNVTANAPSIVAQPQNQAVQIGANATFGVSALGGLPLRYQWRFNGTNISGATTNSFTKVNVQSNDLGSFSVVITNSFGAITSAVATITIAPPPFITNVRTYPGANSAIIAWATVLPATSQVIYDATPAGLLSQKGTNVSNHSEFGSSSFLDTNLVTAHSLLLSDLQPNTTYPFHVLSTVGNTTHESPDANFTTAGTIIVDTPKAITSGIWSNGTASVDKYLTNYYFSFTSNSATATATFTPNITTPGKYDVFAYYPQGSNRATNTPFVISYDGGAQTVLVNQQINGGTWMSLATARPFAAGTSGFVRVSNWASGGTVVIADAVKFVYVEEANLASNAVPTWWSNFYFGTNSINTSLDLDGDGYTTAQEYLFGTSPTDNRSRLNLRFEADSQQLIFSPHHEHRLYQLESLTNLSSINWQVLTNEESALNGFGEAAFTISTNSNSGFFRLRVDPAP